MNARASATALCAVCNSGATRTVGGRLLCDSVSCLQVTPGTRDQEPGTNDQVGTEGNEVKLRIVPGTPGVGLPKEPELEGLVRDHDRGRLEPLPVELGELPVGASRAMQKVATDLRLLIGLRLAVDEDRPLPYSTRFCAERCGLRDQAQASRVLRSLERVGVVECVGRLKPRGKPDGTKLYRPPAVKEDANP